LQGPADPFFGIRNFNVFIKNCHSNCQSCYDHTCI